MGASALQRSMHRVHRAVGSVLALLIACWFASGAVMTFSAYPQLSERERLALAQPLAASTPIELPAPLAADLPRLLADGTRVRLAMHEGEPTWLATNARGERIALRATMPAAVARLDSARARSEAERRLAKPAREVELIDEADQWTVAFAKPENLPFFRVRFADGEHTEAYLSARTGELLQLSTQNERVLAWLGAIPHWIYPTVLRRERELWRYTVLALSSIGLMVTLSGTVIGLHVWRATRKRRAPRDPYLRWHQMLGLWFGLFATTWLFSGALSLSPFQWAGPRGTTRHEQAAMYGGASSPLTAGALGAVLARCQAEIEVRELELLAFATKLYATCASSPEQTRLVDLTVPRAGPLRLAPAAHIGALAQRLALSPDAYSVETANAYDDYYYPTHASPDTVLPFVRITLRDAAQTVYYVDPARMRLLRKHTRLTRLERWLYQGLHSFDIRGLYERRTLWRTLIILAMGVGFVLSGLGALMGWRRSRRAAQRAQRSRSRSDALLNARELANANEDGS